MLCRQRDPLVVHRSGSGTSCHNTYFTLPNLLLLKESPGVELVLLLAVRFECCSILDLPADTTIYGRYTLPRLPSLPRLAHPVQHGSHVRCRHQGVAARCHRRLGGLRGRAEEHRRREGHADFPAGQWRGMRARKQTTRSTADRSLQTKTIETTLAAIAEGKDAKLPPLMNPTMLEASDDLTNLSHLNEPAGKHAFSTRSSSRQRQR